MVLHSTLETTDLPSTDFGNYGQIPVRFNLQTNVKMRAIVRSRQIIVRYVAGRSRHQLLVAKFNLQSVRFQPTANIVQCLPRLFYASVPFPRVLNLS